jgi:hypothetical protein
VCGAICYITIIKDPKQPYLCGCIPGGSEPRYIVCYVKCLFFMSFLSMVKS